MSETALPGAPPSPRSNVAWDQQHTYAFSGRVLLTAVSILFVIAVVFAVTRVLLYHFVGRPGRGGGGGGSGRRRGIFRGSFNSFGRSGRRGLDASALAELPVTAYRKGGGEGSKSGAADCAVCLSELADGDKVRRLPNCGHVFHVECVDAWLRSRTTCPLCRAEAEVPNAQSSSAAATPATASSSQGAGATTVVVTIHGGSADAVGTEARIATALTGQPVRILPVGQL
ncbi:hypothetical protein GUJ93_ZPchr0008g12422 [Zizania palustris]|uniref:RING-type E3 ubiquitin transferase n=1 Tax=Zizania palustris TaxID=103762 RepID=A0A8J5R5U1_ZIZPA|nr:hypothetical protein GUJ93_ZPchr0008g12422 [Zizania palustris]